MQFIFPTVKAVSAVIGLLFTVVTASFYGINQIARVQAEVIEAKMIAVRDADFEHINRRFNRIDKKLDKILRAVK